MLQYSSDVICARFREAKPTQPDIYADSQVKDVTLEAEMHVLHSIRTIVLRDGLVLLARKIGFLFFNNRRAMAFQFARLILWSMFIFLELTYALAPAGMCSLHEAHCLIQRDFVRASIGCNGNQRNLEEEEEMRLSFVALSHLQHACSSRGPSGKVDRAERLAPTGLPIRYRDFCTLAMQGLAISTLGALGMTTSAIALSKSDAGAMPPWIGINVALRSATLSRDNMPALRRCNMWYNQWLVICMGPRSCLRSQKYHSDVRSEGSSNR